MQILVAIEQCRVAFDNSDIAIAFMKAAADSALIQPFVDLVREIAGPHAAEGAQAVVNTCFGSPA